MSTETNNGTLRQYETFYGTQPLLPKGMEGAMNLFSLNELMSQIKETLGNSPILTQAYLIMKRYMESLRINALNNQAALELTQAFGVVQPGVDDNGNIDSKKTKKIISVHQELTTKVSMTTETLRRSLSEITIFMATMQRQILTLLTDHYETLAQQSEKRAKEELKVQQYLNRVETRETVVYQSVTESKSAQKTRITKNEAKKTETLSYLHNLITIVTKIFAPIEKGTQEVKQMLQTA